MSTYLHGGQIVIKPIMRETDRQRYEAGEKQEMKP